jgi:hypothetical protein
MTTTTVKPPMRRKRAKRVENADYLSFAPPDPSRLRAAGRHGDIEAMRQLVLLPSDMEMRYADRADRSCQVQYRAAVTTRPCSR